MYFADSTVKSPHLFFTFNYVWSAAPTPGSKKKSFMFVNIRVKKGETRK